METARLLFNLIRFVPDGNQLLSRYVENPRSTVLLRGRTKKGKKEKRKGMTLRVR